MTAQTAAQRKAAQLQRQKDDQRHADFFRDEKDVLFVHLNNYVTALNREKHGHMLCIKPPSAFEFDSELESADYAHARSMVRSLECTIKAVERLISKIDTF